MPAGERPYALLTMLYRSTDRLRRAGASVKNLPHVPSLSMTRESVPSYTGTEQLGRVDGFAQDESECESHEGAVVLRGFLAS